MELGCLKSDTFFRKERANFVKAAELLLPGLGGWQLISFSRRDRGELGLVIQSASSE